MSLKPTFYCVSLHLAAVQSCGAWKFAQMNPDYTNITQALNAQFNFVLYRKATTKSPKASVQSTPTKYNENF